MFVYCMPGGMVTVNHTDFTLNDTLHIKWSVFITGIRDLANTSLWAVWLFQMQIYTSAQLFTVMMCYRHWKRASIELVSTIPFSDFKRQCRNKPSSMTSLWTSLFSKHWHINTMQFKQSDCGTCTNILASNVQFTLEKHEVFVYYQRPVHMHHF